MRTVKLTRNLGFFRCSALGRERKRRPGSGCALRAGRIAFAAACLLAASTQGSGQGPTGEIPPQPPAQASAQPNRDASITIDLYHGLFADYGATPWYTPNLSVGTSPMRFALDTGTNLLWATSDQCNTAACGVHRRVDTSQPGFSWVRKPQPPQEVSFGPWGSMGVWIGKASFVHTYPALSTPLTFFASVNYRGEKFEYLAWGGGIGFPSESSSVKDTDFYFKALVDSGAVGPAFSIHTNPDTGSGAFILGAPDSSQYDPSTAVNLPPKKSVNPELAYLWGTPLANVQVGTVPLPALQNQIFYLDTGSSRFKGDGAYVYPILNQLLGYKDRRGKDIFEKSYEMVDGQLTWTGLQYASGGPGDYANLPDLRLTLGDACGGVQGRRLEISLSPTQYSYQVEIGDRPYEWVVAVHRLDGVGGLLVGSTLMDFVYAAFQYNRSADGTLSQGNMTLFKKNLGPQPAGYQCVDANREEWTHDRQP